MSSNSVSQLVLDLKEAGEDFEFYPTTKEMIMTIYPYMDREKVLDIGCGTCNFKKIIEQMGKEEYDVLSRIEERKFKEAEARGERYYKKDISICKISRYYVMEKSKILLQQLDEDTVCLGTDFNENTLIDKKVSTIFCNPPYSEFEIWTKKIISEGNFKQAFLVIPQRWKDNIEIKNLLDFYNTDADVLGSFDFLHAERQARAKVDVVRLVRKKYRERYGREQENFDTDAFEGFFNNTFGLDADDKRYKESDYDRSSRIDKEKDEKIHTALVTQVEEGKSKAQILVELYEEEYTTLIKHLNLIMQLDEEVLNTFDFSIKKVKEGLKEQITGMKQRYWKKVFDEMDEITSRLTCKSRNDLYESFQETGCIDFTMSNIYSVILWTIKNANKYYNSQLIDFFVTLSDRENVKPYKSNQKLFEDDGWRWSCKNKRDYVLDYRIIMSSPFRTNWSGSFDRNEFSANRTLQDIKVIANNLGFETLSWNNLPNDFGEKAYIYNRVGEDAFCEYKAYKNGNMHVKFNKEFTKALNVEVSRLLGWIRCKEDIQREFPEELAKGAEKYFKTNYTCIGTNTLMLTTKG